MIKSRLQMLTANFPSNFVNVADDARLDISARYFWSKHQIAFSDVRVSDPKAKGY